MERFLKGRKLLPSPPTPDSSALQLQVAAYADYLRQVRGFSRSTVESHIRTATRFLTFLQVDRTPSVLARVDVSHVERFVRKEGKGVSRGTLQHAIASLRGLLRFLAVFGKVTPGLETQIDTPLLYKEERLPRALPWETVRSFLQSIPRTTPMGRRDHAMFFLIATYGLRVSEVVALTLDDLAWRSAQIRISQVKIRGAMILPLIDEVAAVLADYLRHVQRPTGLRHLFFRVRAPFGPLSRAAVSKAFEAWSRRSGLNIPFQRRPLSPPLVCRSTAAPWYFAEDDWGYPRSPVAGKYCALFAACHRRSARSRAVGAPAQLPDGGAGMNIAFSSSLALLLRRYITLKQTLGRGYVKETGVLLSLDQFLADPKNLYDNFSILKPSTGGVKKKERLRPGTRRTQMRIVRNFCLYRRRGQPQCFVPEIALFPRPHQPLKPYFFSPTEVQELLAQCSPEAHTSFSRCGLKFSPPRRGAPVYHRNAVGRTATPDRGRLRLPTGTLLIRASKFHKSRLLPLPDDVRQEIEVYYDRRRRSLPMTPDTPFVWNSSHGGRAYAS